MKIGLALLFVGASLWLTARGVRAQEGEGSAVEMSAKAGFDGLYKGEYWVPVQVTLSNVGPSIEGQVQVNVGSSTLGNSLRYVQPVSLPTQSEKRLTLYVYLYTLTGDLTVRLVDEDGNTVQTATTDGLDRVRLNDLLYGVVTTEPGAFDFLENVTGAKSRASVAFLSLADLPEVAAAWNALDVIVFHGVDTSQLSMAQMEALSAWIAAGGQLVVAGGPNWQETAAGVAELLPVTISGFESVTDLPGLAEVSGVAFRDPGPYLVTQASLRQGDVLLAEGDRPLLVRQAMGRGSVYFLALDPALAPLLDWDGAEPLFGRIADASQLVPPWGLGAQNSYAAASAVSSLPFLALPSAWQLVLFILVYIVVVGPLNYIVLTRRKRRELAWVTIPALVLLFSGAAYLVGFQLKGNDSVINQMSIAYGRVDGETMRVQSLLGLYSPRRATYDVMLPGDALARPFDQNFGALSGNGNMGDIVEGGNLRLSEIRVDVSGVETFVADHYQPAPPITGQALLRQQDGDFALEATVQNNGQTTLENAALLLGFTAISLGDVEPGEVANVVQKLSASQASAVSVPGFASGPTASYVRPGSSTSPLAMNYDVFLGTVDYFNDREAFPRWQLLQAIAPEYGSSLGAYPKGTVTLVAWSDESQLDTAIEDDRAMTSATTLYFLELPLSQTLAEGQRVTLAKALLTWRVLADSGVYNPSAENLYLPQGWVELEYEPWPEFQEMSVTELAIMLQQPAGLGQPAPRLQLWDWQEEAWVTVKDADWGSNPIDELGRYVDRANTVRLRLQNDGPEGVEILDVHPSLTGNKES
ncbi:MAG: DUF7408 domain-containing protein [Candidatus Promineifilaceae bacterium]